MKANTSSSLLTFSLLALIGPETAKAQLPFVDKSFPLNFRETTNFMEPIDIDLDGDVDVIGTSKEFSSTPNLVVYVNDGHGNFVRLASGANFTVSNTATERRVPPTPADLDGDGDLDLVGTHWAIRNDGFNLSNPNNLVSVAAPWSLAVQATVADFNRDGLMDVACLEADGTAYKLKIFRNDGSFAFTKIHESSVTLTRLTTTEDHHLATGDLDGDQWPDLVVAGATLRLLWNDGGTGFTDASVPGLPTGQAVSVAVGDLDMDGKPEVVSFVDPDPASDSAGSASGQIAVASPNTARVIGTPLAFAVNAQASLGLAIADLDHDGRPDVVGLGNSIGSGDGWLRNVQSGPLSLVAQTGAAPSKPRYADLDADGDVDIAYVIAAPGWASNSTVLGVTLTAREAWRQTHFSQSANTGNAADNADPDSDGLTNIVEYAFGTNPNSGSGADGSIGEPVPDGSASFICWFKVSVPYPPRPDLTLQAQALVQGSTTWKPFLTQLPGMPWAGSGFIEYGAIANGRQELRVAYSDTTNGSAPPQCLVRIKVSAVAP